MKRRPRRYDGPGITTRKMTDLLPGVLRKFQKALENPSEAVLQAWPEVVGPTIAPMTKADSYCDGVLTVIVTHSTLYSLLVQKEKKNILKQLRQSVSSCPIYDIHFRMG